MKIWLDKGMEVKRQPLPPCINTNMGTAVEVSNHSIHPVVPSVPAASPAISPFAQTFNSSLDQRSFAYSNAPVNWVHIPEVNPFLAMQPSRLPSSAILPILTHRDASESCGASPPWLSGPPGMPPLVILQLSKNRI